MHPDSSNFQFVVFFLLHQISDFDKKKGLGKCHSDYICVLNKLASASRRRGSGTKANGLRSHDFSVYECFFLWGHAPRLLLLIPFSDLCAGIPCNLGHIFWTLHSEISSFPKCALLCQYGGFQNLHAIIVTFLLRFSEQTMQRCKSLVDFCANFNWYFLFIF